MTWTATTPGGATLLAREWTPPQAPWLYLVLVHGVSEHSGRYERVGQQFAEAGIAARAFDLRGHGASSGARGDVEAWTELTDDVAWVVAEARAAADGLPVALMGHSMGGLIVLDGVLSGSTSPDLLVLSSPGLGDGLPRWRRALVPWVARIRPTMVIANEWDGSTLSRDPAVGEAIAADPLMLDGVTARLGAGYLASQRRVSAKLGELEVPAFVSHGGEDRLVPPQVSEPLAQLPGVTRRLYPELRHETLFEPEGPEVVADIIAWLHESTDRLE